MPTTSDDVRVFIREAKKLREMAALSSDMVPHYLQGLMSRFNPLWTILRAFYILVGKLDPDALEAYQILENHRSTNHSFYGIFTKAKTVRATDSNRSVATRGPEANKVCLFLFQWFRVFYFYYF